MASVDSAIILGGASRQLFPMQEDSRFRQCGSWSLPRRRPWQRIAAGTWGQRFLAGSALRRPISSSRPIPTARHDPRLRLSLSSHLTVP